MFSFDITIVGAGVIGLAVARALSSDDSLAKLSILVLESEAGPGQQVSSRSSEVIHAGIYYAPGSLKAKLCVEGRGMLYSYCEEFQVAHRRIGKLIVASESQEEALKSLYERAAANAVLDLEYLGKEQIRLKEPAVSADLALYSPSTGILDSHELMLSLQKQAVESGVDFVFKSPLRAINEVGGQLILQTGSKERHSFSSRVIINCAGLHAQEVAALFTPTPGRQRYIPPLRACKGDYFSYRGPSPFNSLIYPVPDENTRGLGIHSTVDMAGVLRFGPDAQYVDRIDYSLDGSKSGAFSRAIKAYFPALEEHRLSPAYSGIRPKIAGPGEAARDFEVVEETIGNATLINLYGFESPGLTSCLAIGEHIKETVKLRV